MTTDLPEKTAKVLAKRIYIIEDFTRKRDSLLYSARQAKKMQRISDTWSYNCNVKINTLHGMIIYVNDESNIPVVYDYDDIYDLQTLTFMIVKL